MKLFTYLVSTIASLSLLGLCSCSSVPGAAEKQMNSPFTSGQVSLTLKKNVTTKAEVLNAFGSPNIVTQDGDGNSVWTYQKNASVTKSGGNSFYWTVVLAGGNSGDSGIMNSTRTMTLIITFNNKDIVSNFKSLATNF